MLELMKKSKAVLSALSVLLCSFAGADAGLGIRQHQDVDVFSSKSLAVNAHATVNRVRVRSRKTVATQSDANAFAIAPVSSIAPQLLSAGRAYFAVLTSYDRSSEGRPSARAPPLS
jgi:hypothetical protein